MKQIELTLEQQFRLQMYAEQIKSISEIEAKKLLVEVMRQNMVKDNVIKDLMRVV
ncbi:MAG: phycobilisome degradation protein NblA [Richelia sp. CSU_2_1]|nr:phycobilisome degradation protein NblA [Richelia sp. CSU_2_1]